MARPEDASRIEWISGGQAFPRDEPVVSLEKMHGGLACPLVIDHRMRTPGPAAHRSATPRFPAVSNMSVNKDTAKKYIDGLNNSDHA
ncbi:hypothetical protein [Paeniglutamicibacter psychrophenolicus]|uniref:hypothetical protein n=1 Tax=Paeniglutamicibacter psychrophenolicus TaxID=257454 RepID=UPI002783717C|nr:hypothetical protein [Paeniglutamicibacter psychrophenolicus]MDQ0093127.1 hypothetical protein [Paeniglutamicibacter psychrophenolicus]